MELRRPLMPLLTALALALAACGGGDDDTAETGGGGADAAPSADPAQTEEAPSGGDALSIKADESQLKFDTDILRAKAGTVTIEMENPSSIPHNVAIEGGGADKKGEVVGKGETSTVTADLKPGRYVFYCSVGGHEAAGMKGSLTVE